MDYLQNLHTHTTYCDGANTPEELVLEAIGKGFDSIGFSGHSYMKRVPHEYSMTLENNNAYRKDIEELKRKYSGIIKVYCGLEADMYSETELEGYDYLIGSVHYIKKDREVIDFDRGDLDINFPGENLCSIIKTSYNGNGAAFVKDYYKTLAQLPLYGKFDIIGHFDLAVKHNERLHFVDEESTEYKKYAIEAAEALAGKIRLFEVNTGAITRGYRKIPYPAPFILKELKRLGFGAVISSDCHKKEYLDFHFEHAVHLLKECGFKERYIFSGDRFTAVEL